MTTDSDRARHNVLGGLEARTIDGTGNNLQNPDWGSTNATYSRIGENSYTDGVEDMARNRPLVPEEVPQTRVPPIAAPNPGPLQPDTRFINQPTGDMPQPRDVSNAIFANPKDENGNDVLIPDARGFNQFGFFFGQVQTHDTAEAPTNVTAISDFSTDHQILALGVPFAIQRTPPRYEDQNGDGVAERQQWNQETSFLDMSHIYGREQLASDLLRRKDADGDGLSGFLLNSNDFGGERNGQNLLPTYGNLNKHHGVFTDDSTTDANEVQLGLGALFDPVLQNFFSLDRFASGDQRVNQNANTITQHTVWMRNHNWHAEQLQEMFPEWTSEQVFQAARIMNEAEYQRVQVNEYLPSIIGNAGFSLIGSYQGYDPNTNPSVINEWTTVAFRFGHDQASNQVEKLDESGNPTLVVTLAQSFELANNAIAVRNSVDLDEWIRGQTADAAGAVDGYVVDGVRNQLFGVTVSPVTGLPVSTDLTVFNMVRGRDHGVNDYGKLREAAGLNPYNGWDDWAADNNVSAERVSSLRGLYNDNFGKLDAYVAGLLEKPWQDSSLGETFTRLTAAQYDVLRDGDRFYYENRLAGSPELLAQVNRTTMADIMERTTGIEHIYRDAFFAHDRIGDTDGDDALGGTAGRDLLVGYDGSDRLFGLAGDDDLHGGAGDDLLSGGGGSDVFEFRRGSGNDVVVDFEIGRDRLDLTDYGLTSWAQVQAAIRSDGFGAAEGLRGPRGPEGLAQHCAEGDGHFAREVDPGRPGAKLVLDAGSSASIVPLGVSAESLTANSFVLWA